MAEQIRTLDREFGHWVIRHFAANLPAADRELLRRLAQAASHAVHLKHTCVDLAVYPALCEPALDKLLDGITAADVLRVVTDAVRPLVCSADGQRIGLQKYHRFEQGVAGALQQLHAQQRLEIVTGGPGTGKTWTASQRIQQVLAADPACVIALAAPTGKAANNMMVALARSGFVAADYNLKGLTLHALLGMNGRSPKPRRDQQHPLACDLLIVDEASMIDLPMMYRLLQAIPSQAKLLLLGDKDQLASVEAGSVMGDICAAFAGRCVTVKHESRRYRDSPEIGALANALNAGTVPDLSGNTAVLLHRLDEATPWQPRWLDDVTRHYGWIADALRSGLASEDILALQGRFQVLSALREGPQGVKGINAMIAKALGHAPDSWYAGRPVMITHNDHERKLYNGDVGMVLEVDGVLKACFMVQGNLKTISLSRMPAHETCYAMTVHKSQGSEYEHVLVVLPADAEAARANPVLTRELVYTAVTRARSRVDIWAGEGVLDVAVARITQRMSGLRLV